MGMVLALIDCPGWDYQALLLTKLQGKFCLLWFLPRITSYSAPPVKGKRADRRRAGLSQHAGKAGKELNRQNASSQIDVMGSGQRRERTGSSREVLVSNSIEKTQKTQDKRSDFAYF